MRGVLSQAGWAASSGWTQAHQAATAKLRLVSETLVTAYEQARSAALIGTAAEHEPQLGICKITGDLTIELAYDDHAMLTYCFGSLVSSAYVFVDDLAAMFHLTIDKGTARYYFQNCMVSAWSVTAAVGETPAQLKMTLVSKFVTSDATAFPTLTNTSTPAIFKHIDQSWLSTSSDATLNATDALPIKSVEVSCDNNLQIDGSDTSDVASVLQPIRNGFRKVTVKVGLARFYTAAQYASVGYLPTWKAAGTPLQYKFRFTPDAGTNHISFWFPQAVIAAGVDWNVQGPQAIEDTLELTCHRNRTNSNMTTVEDQLEVTVA